MKKAACIYLNLILPVVIESITTVTGRGTVTRIIDSLILPGSLIFLNSLLLSFKVETSWVKCTLFMMLGLMLGNMVGFGIWGIWISKTISFHYFRDGESMLWLIWALGYQVVVASAFAVLVNLCRLIFFWVHKHRERVRG